MPNTKKIEQTDVDRMMAEGESEYQSRMKSVDRKARQKKMEEKDAKQPPRKKTSKSLTINGEPDGR